MEPTSSAIGLVVIVALYIAIGAMSAAGSVYISKSILSAKAEQIFSDYSFSQYQAFIWPSRLTLPIRMLCD